MKVNCPVAGQRVTFSLYAPPSRPPPPPPPILLPTSSESPGRRMKKCMCLRPSVNGLFWRPGQNNHDFRLFQLYILGVRIIFLYKSVTSKLFFYTNQSRQNYFSIQISHVKIIFLYKSVTSLSSCSLIDATLYIP